MRRIPLFLVVVASAFAVVSGSALAAVVRVAASPPVNTALPTITGTVKEGQTLTASNGSWSGITPITHDYQWQRCNSTGSSCGSIGNARRREYTVMGNIVNLAARLMQAAKSADGLTQVSVIQAARDQHYANPMFINGITWESTPTAMTGFSGFQTQVWNAANKAFTLEGGVIPTT